jgi:RimJ/RimL family protein N-acetyltransferase
MTTITTDRLVLRPVTMGDIDTLFPLFNDWDVIRWLTVPPWPYARTDMEQFFAGIIERGDVRHERFRVIVLEGAAIGAISIDGQTRRALGYWLGKPYWGRGYMTEAVFGLVREYFASSARRPLTSGAYDGNTASLKVQENVGFVVSRRRPQFCRPQNRDIPLIETELIRGRFLALYGMGKVW